MLARFRRRLSAVFAIAAAVTIVHAACAQSPLTPVPGSPFSLGGWDNSAILRMGPDGHGLFVSTQYGSRVASLAIGSGGGLTLSDVQYASPYNYMATCGMAVNPAGTRLYTVQANFYGSAIVTLHEVDAAGALHWVSDYWLPWGSKAMNGVTYVSRAGGDFVYVNNNSVPNTVSVLAVSPLDGTLSLVQDCATGANGGTWGAWSPQEIDTDGRFLYAINGRSGDLGGNSLSAFSIGDDGQLTALSGSPYALPTGTNVSGAVAFDATDLRVYVGTPNGQIVSYPVDAATGGLGSATTYSAGLWGNFVGSLAVRPGGGYLVAATGSANRIAVLDTASMRPVLGSPVAGTTYVCQAAVFDPAGARLFVGSYYSGIQVGVFDFSEQPPIPPLTLALSADPAASVNRFGEATVSGTLKASVPGPYWVSIEVRQRIGRTVVTASGGFQVVTRKINDQAAWKWTASHPTMAFKSGAAEIRVSTGGSDPVSGEWVSAQSTQTVKLVTTR